MFSYVAMIWDRHDEAACGTAARLTSRMCHPGSELHCVYSSAGMAVYFAPPADRALGIQALPAGRGVILGRVFPRNANAGIGLKFDDVAADDILRTRGRALVDRYWGAYVAFLHDGPSRFDYVIRDCSGWIPCFRTTCERVAILFSALQDLARLSLPPLTLDGRAIAAALQNPLMPSRATGFEQITELLAGDCVELHRSVARQYPLWQPEAIASDRAIENPADARIAIRDTVTCCIQTWARAYCDDSILLSLSGGFDSALVLGCLRDVPMGPRVLCFNQCEKGTADDEVRYASIAATAANVPLHTLPWSDVRIDERLLAIPKAPKPYAGDLFWWLEIGARNELASRCRAHSIWTGQGGDHLFWSFESLPIAEEYLHRHGMRPGLWRVIREEARLSRRSYFSVLRGSRALAHRKGPWMTAEEQDQQGHFVNQDLLGSGCQDDLQNAGTEPVAGLSRVKQTQIRLLADVLNRHHHMPGFELAYQRHPLLSQPLIELCLRIPGYLLVHGGKRRALAREAFRDRIPREILARDDKGETSARVRAMIRENEGFLKELLLEGILVNRRIIRREPLEEILVQGASYRTPADWTLLACITTELWARSWNNSVLHLAA